MGGRLEGLGWVFAGSGGTGIDPQAV